MRPYYFCSGFRDISLDDVLHSTPWIQVTDARLECFMSGTTGTYTYGEGRGVRTYTPVPYSSLVLDIQYQLWWEEANSDDSPGMDPEHPIAVVSFGQPREIWWRERGQTGIIPAGQRQLLEHGSIFVMPAGMQCTRQYRIPKGDKPMLTRVSLTYRHYIPEPLSGAPR